MAADLWWIGERWSARVAARWERAVADTFAAVKSEAERRATRRPAPGRPSGNRP